MTKATGKNIVRPKPVELDCGHTLYFRVRPRKGEQLWCAKCENYEPMAGGDVSAYAKVYHDDFWSQRVTTSTHTVSVYRGGCLLTTDGVDCKHTEEVRGGYTALRNAMNTHMMKAHTRFGSTLNIKHGERLPKDAQAPF